MTIEQVIEGLLALPKRAIIHIWHIQKDTYRGIKASVLHLCESVMLVIHPTNESSLLRNTESTYATSTTSILKSTDVFLAIKKLEKILEQRNLNGLEKSLGITKEGVMRLIWLLEGVRHTRNGSGVYSSETISLVKSALLKERILKQTTFRYDFQQLWTKKKSQPTKRRWLVNGYGIRKMDAHSVVNATAI